MVAQEHQAATENGVIWTGRVIVEDVPEHVLRAAQNGDREAFDKIVETYQTNIFNYLYRLFSGSPYHGQAQQDAYDYTQDVFLKAFLAIGRTDANLKVSPWLYRIAINVFLDEMRHRKLVRFEDWGSYISVFHPSQVAKDNPVHDVIGIEDADEIKEILDRLHPKYRIVMLLFHYNNMTYDEIAELMSITRSAVKSLIFRAREEFRAIIRSRIRAGKPVPGMAV